MNVEDFFGWTCFLFGLFMIFNSVFTINMKVYAEEQELFQDYYVKDLSAYYYNIEFENFTREDNGTRIAGIYDPNTDIIYLYEERGRDTVLHEIGHRVFYLELSESVKSVWYNISNSSSSWVSDYASTSTIEDFAETFQCWYTPNSALNVLVIDGKFVNIGDCREFLSNISSSKYEFFQNFSVLWA